MGKGSGDAGEKIAGAYLESIGARILARNYAARGGEIDLVAELDDTILFVEVKYRANARYGDPADAMTIGKQRRICRAALHYLYMNGMLERSVRFDAILIALPDITHIPSAFDYIE